MKTEVNGYRISVIRRDFRNSNVILKTNFSLRDCLRPLRTLKVGKVLASLRYACAVCVVFLNSFFIIIFLKAVISADTFSLSVLQNILVNTRSPEASAAADVHLHVSPRPASASVRTAGTWARLPIRVSSVAQR